MVVEAILIAVAAIANAIMDRSALNELWGKWWNKGKGWKLKWAYPLQTASRHWWYLGLYKPQFKEKFPFSSTVLVFLTDGWHLFQFIMLTSLQLAITLNLDFIHIVWGEVVELLIAKVLFGVVFQIFYSIIKK